jgi:hypothetical protein
MNSPLDTRILTANPAKYANKKDPPDFVTAKNTKFTKRRITSVKTTDAHGAYY